MINIRNIEVITCDDETFVSVTNDSDFEYSYHPGDTCFVIYMNNGIEQTIDGLLTMDDDSLYINSQRILLTDIIDIFDDH